MIQIDSLIMPSGKPLNFEEIQDLRKGLCREFWLAIRLGHRADVWLRMQLAVEELMVNVNVLRRSFVSPTEVSLWEAGRESCGDGIESSLRELDNPEQLC